MSAADTQGLDLQIHHEPDRVVVRLLGNGSNVYGSQVRDELKSVSDHVPARVTFDLSELTFINSVLVGVIVEFIVRLQRANTALELHEARGQVLDVLERCNVAELLRFTSPRPDRRPDILTHAPPSDRSAQR